MKIAIPLAEGKLAAHFGHCREFAIIEVKENKITKKEILVPPAHEPGVLPRWLHDQGATIVIAGGMGSRAQALFEQKGIHVLVGAPVLEPEELVKCYLNNTLTTGENICSH
jgi:predicted Fe-Mo cluster-binding NifX family protein